MDGSSFSVEIEQPVQAQSKDSALGWMLPRLTTVLFGLDGRGTAR